MSEANTATYEIKDSTPAAHKVETGSAITWVIRNLKTHAATAVIINELIPCAYVMIDRPLAQDGGHEAGRQALVRPQWKERRPQWKEWMEVTY